ncbi:MAG: hypothetical protein L0Y62_06820, partial [Nitrospirae bacterium]|nr:hypothetical protein [Nitrospirota bacterium]
MRTKFFKQCLLPILLCLLVVSPSQINAQVSAGAFDKEASDILAKFGSAMTRVAERVKPAVVNIST